MACDTSPVTGEFYCDSTPVGFPSSSVPPAGAATHSAWDWASLISSSGLQLLTATQQSGTPRPTSNLGIPGSKTPTPPAASKTTGYLIAGVIIVVLILAFRRVTRR